MKTNRAVVKVMPQTSGDDKQSLAPLFREVLARIGEDPKRDGLLRTPERVDKALKFLTSGYRTDLRKIVNGALFEDSLTELS